MSLTTRVSLFFLGALAFVLMGFAIGVYELAGMFFRQSAEERLLTTFHALAASAEIEPDGVEWNPKEHHLAEHRFRESEPIDWLVTTSEGAVIDSSQGAISVIGFAMDARAPADGMIEILDSPDGRPWWVVRQRLTTPVPMGGTASSLKSVPDDADDIPEYPELIVIAGISVASTEAALHRLAAWIVPLAFAVWSVAAVGGRWFCRRALDPVSRMAAATRTMNANAPESRLPVPTSGDELEQLGQAFNGLLDRVHESFEQQRRFTGEASHQLRTPIAVLQGQIEVALRRERSPDEQRVLLEELQTQSRRLGEIVESLLFLARTESESRLTGLQELELGSWLSDHFQKEGAILRRPDFTFNPVQNGPCWISALSPLLEQLVDNLIENAFRYSLPGQRVTAGIERYGDNIQLLIEDHGAGISPDDLLHIFEPFYRARSAISLRREGVGLGLAVARRIAHAVGAEITVQSELGHGTTMRISFPRISEPLSGIGETDRETGSVEDAGSGRKVVVP